MVSAELLNTLRELDPADKRYILQVLTSDLAQSDLAQSDLAQTESDWIQPNQDCPIWSPYDAVEAAEIMLKALNEAKAQNHAER